MEEQLRIFDKEKNPIGVASREDVHKYGYWHEVFHCWMTTRINQESYLYLQLRSPNKKDYPGLYDITAAGHLLAEESVEDGIREVEEELGLRVAFEELISLGTLSYHVETQQIINKEYANVFLYKGNHDFNDFDLQIEEVTGMMRVKLKEFEQLWFNQTDSIIGYAFRVDEQGDRELYENRLGRSDFVPHADAFYKEVIRKIKANV